MKKDLIEDIYNQSKEIEHLETLHICDDISVKDLTFFSILSFIQIVLFFIFSIDLIWLFIGNISIILIGGISGYMKHFNNFDLLLSSQKYFVNNKFKNLIHIIFFFSSLSAIVTPIFASFVLFITFNNSKYNKNKYYDVNIKDVKDNLNENITLLKESNDIIRYLIEKDNKTKKETFVYKNIVSPMLKKRLNDSKYKEEEIAFLSIDNEALIEIQND